MATDHTSSVLNTFIKFILLVLLVLLVIAIAYAGYSRFRRHDRVALPQAAFSSAVEQRQYTDKDGKIITYYVINTHNRTNEDLFSCQFDVVAKGTLIAYHAFLTDYILRDCNKSSTEVKPNYECRLDNGIKQYFKYQPSITLRKFPSGSAHEISVSRFYTEQSQTTYGFYAKNQLNDIYRYDIFCKTANGTEVSHTQLF